MAIEQDGEELVFDLEVEVDHNFITGAGFVVHNCHHSTSKTARSVLEALGCFQEGGPELLGLTATPERSDGLPLGDVYDETVYRLPIQEAIKEGFLVPYKPIQVPLPINPKALKIVNGDFSQSDLDRELARTGAAQATAIAIREHAKDRKTIVFCTSVDQAKRTAEECENLGIKAAWISGAPHMTKKERKEVIRKLAKGEIQVACNAEVLTEGFDDRSVSAIVIAKPTLSQGRYCLDMDTEILGPSGWLKHDQVDVGDTVAGFDPKTGEIRWCKTTGKLERELYADERFVTLKSPTVDFRVTDKHRMLYRNKRDKHEGWRFIEAGDLAARSSESSLPVSGVQHAPGVNISDDDLRFIGWFLTDGTLNSTNNQITICQSIESPFNEAIEKCLVGCGFRYGRHVHKRSETNLGKAAARVIFTVSKGRPLRVEDRHLSGWLRLERFLDKKLAPALEDIDQRQLGILLEAMHCGDGNKQYFAKKAGWTPRSYHISTGDIDLANRVQSLCVRRGFRCNVGTWTPPKDHPFSKNPIYVLHIKMEPEDRRIIGGVGYDDRPTTKIEAGRPGERVWCVETETGTIVTRRNGKVLVMGQCQMSGRGLRTAAHKKDCLIIDLVFATSLGLQTADMLMKQKAKKVMKRRKRKPAEAPGSGIDEWARVSAYLRSAKVDLVEHGELTFARASDDLYVTVAKNGDMVILRRVIEDVEDDDNWVIEHDGQIVSITKCTLQEAMEVCDGIIPDLGGGVTPDSPEWKAATEKQWKPAPITTPVSITFSAADAEAMNSRLKEEFEHRAKREFEALVGLAVKDGRAHLYSKQKVAPEDHCRFGWDENKKPRGAFLGWVEPEKDGAALDPDVAQKLAEESAEIYNARKPACSVSDWKKMFTTFRRLFRGRQVDWLAARLSHLKL